MEVKDFECFNALIYGFEMVGEYNYVEFEKVKILINDLDKKLAYMTKKKEFLENVINSYLYETDIDILKPFQSDYYLLKNPDDTTDILINDFPKT